MAVVLGGGGISLVGAELGSGDKPVTVLLDEPCRLRDTRPNKGIGGRTTPLGQGEMYTVQGTHASGACNVPGDAVGLVTNVTAVSPSTATDLRLYPTGGAVPGTSNLNPAPGQPPTPNSVTVGLSASGQFDILNKFGTVHVIVDVAGYLVDHHHDDRYYTEAQADSRYLGISQDSEAAIDGGDALDLVDFTVDVLATVTVDTPTSGYVIVNSSAYTYGGASSATARCSISKTSSHDTDAYQFAYAPAGHYGSLSGTRGFQINKKFIPSASEMTFNLVCDSYLSTTTSIGDPYLTAVFIPDPDAFGLPVLP